MERKLKILCLHGFRQNKTTFKHKLGSFRKILKNYADFTFVDAPHIIEKIESGDSSEEERSWWFTGEDNEYISKTPSEFAYGFDKSIDFLQTFVNEEGPFDGLLGFSQGATLAALVCSMIELKRFDAAFKFVIIAAGFKSLCEPHSVFYESILNIPSLHVIGDTDNVIAKERSETLTSVFKNCEILTHSGGHFVPAAKHYKDVYVNFVQKFI